MEKVKHTPGPWVASNTPTSDGADFWNICGEDDRVVAFITLRDQVEKRANAHLIAAAPGLLEALKMCLLNGNIDQQERERAESAIAKAEGRS